MLSSKLKQLFAKTKSLTVAEDKLNNGGLNAEMLVENELEVVVEQQKSINNNNHEFVDLGLSVKWATCDLGASKPDEVGDLFAWGEVKTKDEFTWENYKWFREDEDCGYMATKYNSNSEYGDVDNITRLELEDDAARVNWGGDWRIPTEDEFQELIDNCTFEVLFTNMDRIKEIYDDYDAWNEYSREELDKLLEARIKITSKKNGNSIYMYAPMTEGSSFLSYLTSDGNPDDCCHERPTVLAHEVIFGEIWGYDTIDTILDLELEWGEREFGHRIRPVIK